MSKTQKTKLRKPGPVSCDCHPGVSWPLGQWGKNCPISALEAEIEQLRSGFSAAIVTCEIYEAALRQIAQGAQACDYKSSRLTAARLSGIAGGVLPKRKRRL